MPLAPAAGSSSMVAPEEPVGWWGPVWTAPARRSLPELVGNGLLPPEVAGLLGALLARRASIIVGAGPSGAGKTALLTALLAELPADVRRIYLRGCYETFSFLTESAADPRRTVLLVNEISGHLPIYLWGTGVRRVLEAVRAGYGLAATAHATSVEELIGTLAGYPLGVPAATIAAVDLIVLLDAWRTDGTLRREVMTIASLGPSGMGQQAIAVTPLVERSARGGPMAMDRVAAAALYERLGGDPEALAGEIERRADWYRSPGNQGDMFGR